MFAVIIDSSRPTTANSRVRESDTQGFQIQRNFRLEEDRERVRQWAHVTGSADIQPQINRNGSQGQDAYQR